ncbi:hypothetical protein OESDEN_07281 [Oesophagostomum dentatum]|uniref:Saposin B-type domain-containing protein n=1 Tax=Oesophagostomum dentatum TaxID=61180 RepID=A0A0B1TBU6_OESDE|nr:hypothetical protein OESDEN_07281 [Oesophagostomum dentatum]
MKAFLFILFSSFCFTLSQRRDLDACPVCRHVVEKIGDLFRARGDLPPNMVRDNVCNRLPQHIRYITPGETVHLCHRIVAHALSDKSIIARLDVSKHFGPYSQQLEIID